MCAAASVKLGLYLPADLHARMLAANRGRPRGAVQDDCAAALAGRLDVLDAGERSTFACVRGPKRRAPDLNSMGRLTENFSLRLRLKLKRRNLKVTDLACAATERRHPSPGD